MSAPNVRIVRQVRTDQGALIKTEVAGSWFSPPMSVDWIKKELKAFQTEEPQAGWKLQAHGTENGWHDWECELCGKPGCNQGCLHPKDPRIQAAFLCLDIQENETVMKGRARFKGAAQLQRIIEYLIETAE